MTAHNLQHKLLPIAMSRVHDPMRSLHYKVYLNIVICNTHIIFYWELNNLLHANRKING